MFHVDVGGCHMEASEVDNLKLDCPFTNETFFFFDFHVT